MQRGDLDSKTDIPGDAAQANNASVTIANAFGLGSTLTHTADLAAENETTEWQPCMASRQGLLTRSRRANRLRLNHGV